MIAPVGEYYREKPRTFEVRQGEPSEDVLEERRSFVVGMKWFPPGYEGDRDEYDSHPGTYHFTRRDEEGVLASMRLTPVESIESSLSYAMVSASPEMQNAAKENESLVADGDLWDLTRLVSPLDRLQSTAAQEAMVELFGMAASVSAKSVEAADKNVYWVFSTTPWTLRFLEKTGIESRVLAEGRLPDATGRPKTTYFCMVDVAAAIEALRASDQHQDTYELLRSGDMNMTMTEAGAA